MARQHKTAAWQRLRAQVIREEPYCWLRLDGCTHYTQTADHVITVKARPDLALVRANVRGACIHCNLKRGAKPIEALGVGQSDALAFFG